MVLKTRFICGLQRFAVILHTLCVRKSIVDVIWMLTGALLHGETILNTLWYVSQGIEHIIDASRLIFASIKSVS